MLILLPPSQGKAAAAQGPVLDLESLSFPVLTATRVRVLDSLHRLACGPVARARTVLGLGPRQDAEIERNRSLRDSPTLAVAELYTGVLYDALDLPSLDAASRRRAVRRVVVTSGLWGALRLDDRVPGYRCPIDVELPRLGRLSRLWREPLGRALPEAAGDGLVVDLRSSAYAAAWAPEGEMASRTATVRVVQRLADGSERVVSHHNKAAKGRLTRSLVRLRGEPTSPADLAEVLAGLGEDLRLEPADRGRPARLTLVVGAL